MSIVFQKLLEIFVLVKLNKESMTMEKKVCEVKKIVLNIDGKEISLTIEQAKN